MLFENSVADLDEATEETIVEEPTEVEETEVDELDNEDGETEESEGSEPENDEDSDDDVFIVDGQEFTLEQLENAKDIESTKKSLQADYTNKTMTLAKERKEVESTKDSLLTLTAELQVLVNEDGDIDWKELKEDDPDEYIRLKEKTDARKGALDKAKADLAGLNSAKPSEEETQAQQAQLIEAFPEWVNKDDSGNVTGVTEQYSKDLQAMSKHALELGFTEQQLSTINSAPIFKAIMNSLKSTERKAKVEVVKKKVAPKSVKPSKPKPQKAEGGLFSKSINRG